MILPFALVIVLITVVSALNIFGLVQTMTGGGPFFATEVMELYIYRNAFGAGAAAPAWLRLGRRHLLRRHRARHLAAARLGPQEGQRRSFPDEDGYGGDPMQVPLAQPIAPPGPNPERLRVRRRWMSRARSSPTCILLPICFLWIYPFLWMVSAGFKTDREIYSGLSLIPSALRWENFERAWTVARIGDVLHQHHDHHARLDRDRALSRSR